MTDQNDTISAGAQSVGIDLRVPSPKMSDINATVGELLRHVDDVTEATGHSTWLQNAISAIESARQYLESHLHAFEAKVKAEFASIEGKADDEVVAVEAEVKSEVTAVEAVGDKAKAEVSAVERKASFSLGAAEEVDVPAQSVVKAD